jgi:Flp pilus assembly protein TadG
MASNRPIGGCRRDETGSIGALFICALLIVGLGLGAFALDFAHMMAVRSELQNASDAAALAGATAFAKDEDELAETHALEVAGQNHADGRPVSNDSVETEVTAQSFPSGLTGEPDLVEVDARMAVNHMLAPIFGRRKDTIAVTSKAGYYPTLRMLGPNQAFPIAVSVDQWPRGPEGGDLPVNRLKKGDPVTIIISPSAQPGRNAAWTSFNISSANTDTYVELIEQALGMAPPNEDVSIPQLEVGVDEIALDNGINNGTDLNGKYEAPAKAKPFLVMPLIQGNQYNQKQTVIGFITVKIKSIKYKSGDFEILGTLVKGIVRGWGGEIPGTGNGQNNQAVNDLSPAVVKLLTAGAGN